MCIRDRVEAYDLETSLQVVDIDGDGDPDLVGNDAMTGYTTAIWDGSTFTSTTTQVVYTNSPVFGDWDGSGNNRALLIDTGTPDGSDSTFTGSISVRGLSSTGIQSSNLQTLEPITAPRRIVLVDFDSDGIPEHVVEGGESSRSLFIAGWHQMEMDLDADGTAEADVSGYAGNGSQGVNPIEWFDTMGVLGQKVQSELQGSTINTNLFGTDFSIIQPYARVLSLIHI